MKKFVAYFFLTVYLFSNTEAREVLKFPKLIEHYISHKIQNEDTTLYSFFKMHYLDAPIKDADYKQDMKLPFKTQIVSTASVFVTTPPKTFEFSFENHQIPAEKKQNFSYSAHFTTQHLDSVFRPPIFI